MTSAKPRVLEAACNAFLLASLAYIKPGAPHRFSPDRNLHSYASLASCLLGELSAAFDVGASVAKGSRSFRDVGVAFHAVECLKKVIAKYKKPLLPFAVLSTSILASAAGYVEASRKEVNASNVLSAYTMILSTATSHDVSAMVRELYNLGVFEDELSRAGITAHRVEVESLTLDDVFSAIAKASSGNAAELLTARARPLHAYSVITKSYAKHRDSNNAVVEGYLELLSSVKPGLADGIKSARARGCMLTRDGAKTLMMLDRELRRTGFDGTYVLEELIPATMIACIDGLTPD